MAKKIIYPTTEEIVAYNQAIVQEMRRKKLTKAEIKINEDMLNLLKQIKESAREQRYGQIIWNVLNLSQKVKAPEGYWLYDVEDKELLILLRKYKDILTRGNKNYLRLFNQNFERNKYIFDKSKNKEK